MEDEGIFKDEKDEGKGGSVGKTPLRYYALRNKIRAKV